MSAKPRKRALCLHGKPKRNCRSGKGIRVSGERGVLKSTLWVERPATGYLLARVKSQSTQVQAAVVESVRAASEDKQLAALLLRHGLVLLSNFLLIVWDWVVIVRDVIKHRQTGSWSITNYSTINCQVSS